jgi:hypothetical protein
MRLHLISSPHHRLSELHARLFGCYVYSLMASVILRPHNVSAGDPRRGSRVLTAQRGAEFSSSHRILGWQCRSLGHVILVSSGACRFVYQWSGVGEGTCLLCEFPVPIVTKEISIPFYSRVSANHQLFVRLQDVHPFPLCLASTAVQIRPLLCWDASKVWRSSMHAHRYRHQLS